MIVHAGIESERRFYHLTWCGIEVPARRAPLKQSASKVTCKRCRKRIATVMDQTRMKLMTPLESTGWLGGAGYQVIDVRKEQDN